MSILQQQLFNICIKLGQALPGQPCVLCGARSDAGVWCAACDAALPYLTAPRCPSCALPTPTGTFCGQCLKRRPQFDHTVAVFAYTFPADKLVQALKYGERLTLAEALAKRMTQRIESRPDCIMPMPLHPDRLRERGFNQSLELARRVAHKLDITLLADDARRVRNTAPQSVLPWKERGRNMRNAFACSKDLSGLHVAIVDDVMTTGATLNGLAQVLRRAGARQVSAWVLARTLPHSN